MSQRGPGRGPSIGHGDRGGNTYVNPLPQGEERVTSVIKWVGTTASLFLGRSQKQEGKKEENLGKRSRREFSPLPQGLQREKGY